MWFDEPSRPLVQQWSVALARLEHAGQLDLDYAHSLTGTTPLACFGAMASNAIEPGVSCS
jgi:hypothetical protein